MLIYISIGFVIVIALNFIDITLDPENSWVKRLEKLDVLGRILAIILISVLYMIFWPVIIIYNYMIMAKGSE